MKSNQIQKDLTKKQVVLDINFDSEKSTQKPDGKEVVTEISKVLKDDNSLKIHMNGYTDNKGNDSHNLRLSKAQAETVRNLLFYQELVTIV